MAVDDLACSAGAFATGTADAQISVQVANIAGTIFNCEFYFTVSDIAADTDIHNASPGVVFGNGIDNTSHLGLFQGFCCVGIFCLNIKWLIVFSLSLIGRKNRGEVAQNGCFSLSGSSILCRVYVGNECKVMLWEALV